MRPADPRRAAERVARLSYGRLVALLAARSGGDLASAEDALGDALARALERWPRDGVPANSEGWRMTAARRRLIDAARMRGTAAVKEDEVMRRYEERAAEEHVWPEERLMLLYACTHPAVPAPDHTPLMLQVVLGLPARRIAGPFLTTPAAMGQRLSRAKARIAAARSTGGTVCSQRRSGAACHRRRWRARCWTRSLEPILQPGSGSGAKRASSPPFAPEGLFERAVRSAFALD